MTEAHELIARADSLARTKDEKEAVAHHRKYLENALRNLWVNDERIQREWFEGFIAQHE